MKYCRYCGKELVDGLCDCAEFQNQVPITESANPIRTKDPLIIPSFKVNTKSASAFISSIRDLSGMSEATNNTGDPYEYNVPIIPDCIAPEENEVVVKQYNIAKLRSRLKFMKAEGRMMVTNRRVIFRAAGTSLTGNLLQEHQFNLDEIGGIEMHKDYKFSLLSFFGCVLFLILTHIYVVSEIMATRLNGVTVAASCLLGLMGLVPTFVVYKRFWLKLFCSYVSCAAFFTVQSAGWLCQLLYIVALLIFVVNVVIVCFVPNLVIKIKTKGASGALVIGSQKAMLLRKTGDEYSGFTEVMPWEDTIMAINELGTLIDDLQKHGDYAIEKWS